MNSSQYISLEIFCVLLVNLLCSCHFSFIFNNFYIVFGTMTVEVSIIEIFYAGEYFLF